MPVQPIRFHVATEVAPPVRPAIAWLESARRFHAAVQHPATRAVVRQITTATGFGLVEEWGPGEILSDGYDLAVLPADNGASSYRRFLRRPVDRIAKAVDQLIDIHVAVPTPDTSPSTCTTGVSSTTSGRTGVRLIHTVGGFHAAWRASQASMTAR